MPALHLLWKKKSRQDRKHKRKKKTATDKPYKSAKIVENVDEQTKQ